MTMPVPILIWKEIVICEELKNQKKKTQLFHVIVHRKSNRDLQI